MQNPWDRERNLREAQGEADIPSGNGWAWIIAVIVAVIGLFAVSKNEGNHLVLVPVGISVFFMFMFLIHHRREVRRTESLRRLQRIEQSRGQNEPMGMEPPPPAHDAALRRVFDRFDLKVIEHGRRNRWEPKQISSLLEMARDFVDVPHASGLLRAKEDTELDRHLDAALERGLLQYDIANNRKGDNDRTTRYYDDGPPF